MSHTLKFINRWDSKINSFCHCYKMKIEDIDTILLEQYDKAMDLPFRKRSKPEPTLNTYFPFRPSQKIREPKDFLIFSGDPKRKDWLNIFTKSGQSASTISSLLLVKINKQLFLKIKKGKPVILTGSVLNIFLRGEIVTKKTMKNASMFHMFSLVFCCPTFCSCFKPICFPAFAALPKN